jgi:hypothetical protein
MVMGTPLSGMSVQTLRGKWKDNIKTCLTWVGYEDVHWFELAQDIQMEAMALWCLILWFFYHLGGWLAG